MCLDNLAAQVEAEAVSGVIFSDQLYQLYEIEANKNETELKLSTF